MCPTCRFPTEVVSMAMSALLICKQSTGSRPPKALDPAIGPIENLVRKCARSMHASIGLPLSAAAALHTSAHGLSIPSQLATLTSACTIASSFQYQKTKPGRLYDSKAVKAQYIQYMHWKQNASKTPASAWKCDKPHPEEIKVFLQSFLF
ncbi:hypothetical protein BRADI_4g36980v3 [Brachypodium distachyon]|uniref:Uncharacterized protein n=1 Tax=Brachypodium distachyon TaxID=15368 RepID=A0A2K2CSR4_BRADI|nr:hypothetical protein BRADI_4g36980v3 [Brachypodium distachyon]